MARKEEKTQKPVKTTKSKKEPKKAIKEELPETQDELVEENIDAQNQGGDIDPEDSGGDWKAKVVQPKVILPAKKLHRLEKLVKKQEQKQHAIQKSIIYVGRLPYGFFEEQLSGYFSQYGKIKRLRLARSKKTARSKGYAFIQFEYPEIAAIAARSIDGYIMEKKQLQCHVLDETHRNPFTGTSIDRKFRYINFKAQHKRLINKERNESENKKVATRLLRTESKKRQKLKQLGIKYNYPGYASEAQNSEN